MAEAAPRMDTRSKVWRAEPSHP